MNVNDGGPAFPTFSAISHCDEGGASLRDYFAAKATEEDVRAHLTIYVSGAEPISRSREAAKFAYADAMLRARGAQ